LYKIIEKNYFLAPNVLQNIIIVNEVKKYIQTLMKCVFKQRINFVTVWKASFISNFRRARHLFLTLARWIQFVPKTVIFILIFLFHICVEYRRRRFHSY